jgi:Sigma-70, region 4
MRKSAPATLTVPQRTPQEAGEITIDFLFVDLTTCARSVGTDRSLELTEFDGLTQTQAAAQLGISVSGMKTRVQRARGQLKDLLPTAATFSSTAVAE